MKISIIIPVYNSEKFLKKLLTSILNQTYNNYEIIIVNDGSTDNSEEIIKSFNSKLIKYIKISNSGPGIARRIGYNHSTGDLIFFVDSDDYLPSDNILENINTIYNNNKFDILLFNFIRKTNKGEKITNVLFNNKLKEKMYDEKFLKYNRIEGALWGKIFVKNKLKEEYFCNYNNFEDYYTTYLYLNDCKKIYYTKKIFYYANRDNENSISKKYDINKYLNTVELLEKIYSSSKYKDVVSTIICNYYTFAINKLYKSDLNTDDKKYLIIKLNELKKYIKIQSILKVKNSKKILIKLVFIFFKGLINKNEK